MNQYSEKSLQRLATCARPLQVLMHEVLVIRDHTIVCGFRSEFEQNEAFRLGHSKLQFPESKHNSVPSEAVDAVPYPIKWNDPDPKIRKRYEIECYHFAGIVLGVAAKLDIPIRWGGNWDGDGDLFDQTFFDLPHFELKPGWKEHWDV